MELEVKDMLLVLGVFQTACHFFRHFLNVRKKGETPVYPCATDLLSDEQENPIKPKNSPARHGLTSPKLPRRLANVGTSISSPPPLIVIKGTTYSSPFPV